MPLYLPGKFGGSRPELKLDRVEDPRKRRLILPSDGDPDLFDPDEWPRMQAEALKEKRTLGGLLLTLEDAEDRPREPSTGSKLWMPKPGEYGTPRSRQTYSLGFGSRNIGFKPKPALPSPSELPLRLEAHDQLSAPILVPGSDRHELRSSDSVKAFELPEEILPPPSRTQLEQLKRLDAPVMVLGRMVSKAGEDKTTARYAVVLPKGFDPARKPPYAVRVLAPPKKDKFDDAARALARSLPEVEDEVLILPELQGPYAGPSINLEPPKKAVDLARHVVESNVLDWLQDDYNLDFTRYRAQALSKDAGQWSGAIEAFSGPAIDLELTQVATKHGWKSVPPTRNWRRKFSGLAAQQLSPELMKQAPDRGRLFVTEIKSGFSTKPIGVFLPPGFDPDAKEKTPVLVMQPGMGMRIFHWTSCGQASAHLNHMMSGDALKMIVLFSDHGDRVGSVDLLNFAFDKLNGDPDRLAMGGISMGAGRVQDYLEGAQEKGYPVPKSIALHSGYPRASLKVPKGTRVYVDATDDEGRTRSAVEFTKTQREGGTEVEFKLHGSESQTLKHDWAAWEQVFESWIGFHQEALGGQAGPARVPKNLEDRSQAALDAPPPPPPKIDWDDELPVYLL